MVAAPGRNLPGGTSHLAPYRRHAMTHATQLWSLWQALLQRFAWGFSHRGFPRFAEWITALAINVEEHTVTQSVLALRLPDDWKAMESFVEYGPGPALAWLSCLGPR